MGATKRLAEMVCQALQAGCVGLGDEIFVTDMGELVKIVDLARDGRTRE
jgi:FlaA1/EpsC-like NDP-sugar epimerase